MDDSINSLAPGAQLPRIRAELRDLCLRLITQGVKPWVIAQALQGEVSYFEKLSRGDVKHER